jgi:uncharacterized protein YndB with AHSA1/START domain
MFHMTAASNDIPGLLSLMKIEVSHHFDAPIETVWELLSDVERMAGLGPEHVEASWADHTRGVGAQFIGRNERGEMEWEVPCHITDCVPPRRLAWTVLEPDNPSSRWSYDLTSDANGTTVVQRFEHGPNYSFTRIWAEEHPDEAERIIRERTEMLQSDMKTTLVNAARRLRSGE